MEKTFTEKDIKEIENRGIPLEKIKQQMIFFRDGLPKINLIKSATIGDGIFKLSEEEVQRFSTYFDKHKDNYSIEKFVPASGAATRMFKFLIDFLKYFDVRKDTINSYVNTKKSKDLYIFIIGLKNLPFYTILKEKTIQIYPNYASFSNDEKYYFLIKTLLDEEGLDFARKPKGILPFHKKRDTVLTPFEENIFEADFYKKEATKTKLHLTINQEFQSDFERIATPFSAFDINFSYQNKSTDTLAVDENNIPFRLEDNSLFFRPAGHGALIENLNMLTSQLVFIKNIDNVSQNNKEIITLYKKLLGGVLIQLQFQIFKFLNRLSEKNNTDEELNEIIDFVEKKACFPLPDEFQYFQKTYKIDYLIKVLNRPIRVCGMVKNEGEPGGGPFWVRDEKGRQTLQIVESSQIDLNDRIQSKILKSATHFNPVDIVCGIYDYKGNKFNLTDFIDPKTAFITEKTKNGETIKAFELPGLWNGAMSKWTTIFIEVPLETFNPVKTVNDLLKPSHQPENE